VSSWPYAAGSRRRINFLIEPSNERRDAAMLLQQAGPAAFIAFASNADYLAGIGHRAAALEDPRLLRRRESGW
jgi:hypothetical protein